MLAMLIALTGVVMADCGNGSPVLLFNGNAGNIKDGVSSITAAQCDGFVSTDYAYSSDSSNGNLANRPLLAGQTYLQANYGESTFATGGMTTYANNFTANLPTVAGQTSTIDTDRNIMFESANGQIITDEGINTGIYGQFPMNGSSAALGSGGPQLVNHIAGYSTSFSADNLQLSTQNNLALGTVNLPTTLIGQSPSLAQLSTNVAAIGHGSGFSTMSGYAYDQTGLTNSTALGTQSNYHESMMLNNNFVVQKAFNWNLVNKPTIQNLAPTSLCPW